jgi:hypothetical protein
MIFKPELAQKILEGKKTQTRRLVKSDKPRYKVGHIYAFSDGRGKKTLGYIWIVFIDKQYIQDIYWKDCIAEGINGRRPRDIVRKFALLWDSIHKKKGTRFEDNPLVFVYDFRLERRANGI